MVRVVTEGRYRVYVRREEGVRHHRPHCHVEWGDGRCSIALDNLEVLAGHATRQALETVAAHWDELVAAWTKLNA